VAGWNRVAQRLYLSDNTNGRLYRYTLNTTTGAFAAASTPYYTYPTAVGTRPLTGLNADGPRMTLAFEKMLVDLTLPDSAAAAVGATSKQWAVNRRYQLPAPYQDAIFFNSQLYILCNDSAMAGGKLSWQVAELGGWRSSIVAWDGADLFPVAEFPYTFSARSIVEYAGRVYIGGAAQDISGYDSAYGELYELTGSSLRAIRGFGNEARNTLMTGLLDGPSVLNHLLVFEGFLWYYNDAQTRLDFYDVTTDAFYGGPTVSYAGDTDNVVPVSLGDRVGTYRQLNRINSGSPSNSDASIGWVAQPSDTSVSYSSELITSDFAWEPAKSKVLNTVVVQTRGLAASAAAVSYDGGSSWKGLNLAATETDGDWIATHWDTNGVAADGESGKRFRIRVTIAAPDPDGYGELSSISTAFTILGTGRKAWHFTVLGAEKIEGYGGAKFSQDTADIATSLFDWMEAGTTLVYTDLDGTDYTVRVYDVREAQLTIGPKVAFADGTRPEAHFTVVLIEV
jgi:hypothetical protein